MDLDTKKISKAVKALFAVVSQKEKKTQFIDEPDQIHLQFTFKKVPHVKNKNIQLKLPHSVQRDNQDVCLFVKDLKKRQRDYAPSVAHYKDLLEENGVTQIAEIIPLKSLKTEYKPYEAKRVLSERFDTFLADKCIIRLLPDFLGKNFYGRKRSPVGVNLDSKNLKKEINGVLDNSRCIVSGRGSSCMATVAHSNMEQGHVVDNIIASANQIAAGIPGGPVNIKNMHIKTMTSMAIPLYIGGDETVILPKVVKKSYEIEAEEITTLMGMKVKVTPYGDVAIISDKRGAHILDFDNDSDLDLCDVSQKRKKFKSSQIKSRKPKKSGRTRPLVTLKGKTGKAGIKQPKRKLAVKKT